MRSEASIPHSESVAAWSDQLLEEIGESLQGDDALPAVLDFLGGNPLRYLEEIRSLQTMDSSEAQGINSNFAPLVRRLEIMSQINAVGTAIERFLANNRSNISWENRRAIDINFKDRLNNARRLLREDPEDYLEEANQGSSYEQYMGQLGQKTFFSLTKREILDLILHQREYIRDLERTLKLKD